MHDVLKKLGQHVLVPVITIENPDRAPGLGAALMAGGLPVAEITFRTEGAADALSAMAAAEPDIIIGAGTILSIEQAERAVDAGAKYLISPGLNPTLVKWCQDHDIPITPGVCTPTEIETALGLGLSVLKFFPAGAFGGIKTLKAVSAPYRHVKFIPTGGISVDNLRDYLDLQCVHACGGSWMVPGDAINSGNFDQITTLTREAVDIAQSVRS